MAFEPCPSEIFFYDGREESTTTPTASFIAEEILGGPVKVVAQAVKLVYPDEVPDYLRGELAQDGELMVLAVVVYKKSS
jgi:hypothetical protein